MKVIALPSRINMLVARILDTLVQPTAPPAKISAGKGSSQGRHKRQHRKDISYYLQVTDSTTHQIVGCLTDISSGGFKLDSQIAIPANKDFRFRMNVTRDVSSKPFMEFVARSRWCSVDPLDPFCFNIGYQLIHISGEDLEIFSRMMEKYGTEQEHRNIDLRHSNRW